MTRLKKTKTHCIAAIDIGTQTFRLAVAGVEGKRVVPKASELINVRLGEGLTEKNHTISPVALARAEKAFYSFSQTLSRFSPCTISAVATAAMRQSTNPGQLLKIASKYAIPVEIIDWQREAYYTWKGVCCSIGMVEKPCLVIDIGGGSTEFILAKQEKILYSTSLDVGAVNLTNRIKLSDPPSSEQKRKLLCGASDLISSVKGQLPKNPALIIGVGGTATTLAAMDLKLENYEPSKIRGHRLNKPYLQKLWNDMCSETRAARAKRPGLENQRADIILAGTALLLQTLKGLHKDKMLVSDGGLLLGVLYSLIEREYPEHVESSNTHSLYL